MHPPAHPSRASAAPRRRGAVAAAVGCLLALTAGTTAARADVPPAAAPSPIQTVTPVATQPVALPVAEQRSRASVVTSTSVTDPDDTDGRFDIASIGHVVSEADHHHVWLSYTLSTFPSWIDLRLDRRYRTFVLELNRDGHPGSEVNVRVSKADGRIVAELISNATRRVIQRVRVSRPDDHSLTISGPRTVLGARSYFWTSNFHTTAPHTLCGQRDGYPVTCQDSVPRVGWIRLSRPAWPNESR